MKGKIMTNAYKEKALFVTKKGALSAALKVCSARGMANNVMVSAIKLHNVIRRGQMVGYEVWYIDGVLRRPVYESEV